MSSTMLGWRNYRYGKWALLLGVISLALYLSQGANSGQPPNGGTWQGYVLGTVGAGLIIWLTALGVRKRRYRSTSGTVEGWTSAHIYLGSILLLVATLHCAMQFGWNVHTLAYVLMCLVIVSGFYGLYAYIHVPGLLASNSEGKNRATWMAELSELDGRIRDVLESCDAQLQAMALSALELTRLGGSLRQQLSAKDRSSIQISGGKPVANVEQELVLTALSERIPKAQKQSEAEVLNQLLALFGRRQVILHLLRKDIQLKGLVKIWLYFHIPLSMALLAALLIHIITVFIYW